MTKVVAIIPARGGSKRIPKKNIKDFHSLPLISYSIKVALNSQLFDEVIVSTDDEEVAKIAKEYGASVPFLRDAKLSGDFVGTREVIQDVIEFLEKNGYKIDFYCTIYATAPFLKTKYLQEGFDRLKRSAATNSFSCTSFAFPIQRAFKITNEHRCEMFDEKNYFSRSQDLEDGYHDAAQFYWTNRNFEKCNENKIMFSKNSIPIIIPRYLVQDIDTLEDWKRAEIMYEVLKRSGEL